MNLSELKNLIGSVIVRGTSIRRMQRCSQRRAEFVQRSAEVHHLSGNTCCGKTVQQKSDGDEFDQRSRWRITIHPIRTDFGLPDHAGPTAQRQQ